jgi:hypothetical protein
LFWGDKQGFGPRSFAIDCYSNSYELLGSQPALFDGGWEPPVLQVNDNQPRTNKAGPNLSTPISGRAGLPIVFRRLSLALPGDPAFLPKSFLSLSVSD